MTTDKTTNTLLRYITIVGLFAVAFVPLIVNTHMFFLFITGKAYTFRIIVEIVFALWLILALRDRSYFPRRSWIFGGAAAFIVILALADIFSVEPLRSLSSNYERMEGFVLLAHCFMYFVALAGVMAPNLVDKAGEITEAARVWSMKAWGWFAHVSLFVSVIIGLKGFSEIFAQQSFNLSVLIEGSVRIQSTLGNSTYLGVYALIHFFLVLFLAIRYFEKNRGSLKTQLSAWVFGGYGILAIFEFLVMYNTGTRGSVVGIGIGLIIAAALIAIFERKDKVIRNSGITIITLVLLAIAFLGIFKDSAFIKESRLLSRFSALATFNLKELASNEGRARFMIWGTAYQGFLERPLLGWGQDNFGYPFAKYYNPAMYDQEAWFDRTHNVILDWLISAGILGLLAYLFMYAATLWYIWKNRQGTTGLSFAQKSTLTGLLAAYFIHNLFVFDNIPSYIIFFSIIAFVHCLAAKKPLIAGPVEDIHKPVFSDPVIVNYIGVPVIGIVLVVGLYFTNIPGLRANTTLIDAMSLCNTGRYAEAKIAFKMALAENQYVGIQQTREQVMTCAGRVFSDTDVSRSTSSLKQEWFTYAVETLDEQTKLTPNDIRGLYFAGVFFNALKQWSSGAPYLEQALQIAPAKQIIQVQLGANYLNTPGKEADALKLFTIAYKTAPKMESAAIGYAQALVINGKYPEAVKEFGATSSVMTSDDLIAVHLKLKSFDLLIAAANARIKANSNDIQALFYRGVAQYKLGREYAALADLDTISKKLPDNVQIKEIIKQIQAGKDPFTSLFASSEK